MVAAFGMGHMPLRALLALQTLHHPALALARRSGGWRRHMARRSTGRRRVRGRAVRCGAGGMGRSRAGARRSSRRGWRARVVGALAGELRDRRRRERIGVKAIRPDVRELEVGVHPRDADDVGSRWLLVATTLDIDLAMRKISSMEQRSDAETILTSSSGRTGAGPHREEQCCKKRLASKFLMFA